MPNIQHIFKVAEKEAEDREAGHLISNQEKL